MTKKPADPASKLFKPAAETAPASVAATAAPIDLTNAAVITLAPASPTEWRSRIATLESKLAAAKAEAGRIGEMLEVIELQVVAAEPGAMELLHRYQTEQATSARSVSSLEGAIARAQRELQKSEAVEAEAVRQKRLGERRAVALKYITAAAHLDAALAATDKAASAYTAACRALDAYRDLDGLMPSTGILRSVTRIAGAVWKDSEALAKLLGLPALPPSARQRSLATMAADQFAGLLSGAAIDAAMATVPGGSLAISPEAAEPDPLLGQHGAEVLTELSTGGRTYGPGDLISGEVCLTWKLKNRLALAGSGKVRFLSAPAVAAPELLN